MNIEQIKNTFSPLDINTGPGADAYNPQVSEIVERNNVACIIRHPSENSFLISKWKKVDWNGFLTGGIEEGSDKIETATQELKEESGFLNIRKIVDMNFASHGLFYHVIKNQNRLAHYNLVYIELENLERVEVSEEEKAICDFVWVEESKVLETLTRNDMKYLFEFYQSNKNF